jgi:hypothetical protein
MAVAWGLSYNLANLHWIRSGDDMLESTPPAKRVQSPLPILQNALKLEGAARLLPSFSMVRQKSKNSKPAMNRAP